MNLKDFKPESQEFGSDSQMAEHGITDSIYHQEINTLKIDKLSNRVTIISFIIPCIIGAILLFAYFDMKEKVVDADLTKKHQYEKISQQLEEKLNALDIKIAKNKFNFDNKLPELAKKNIALEGQIAKLSTTKADTKTIKTRLSKIEKRITNNANQDKTTILTIERINKETLLTIKENQVQFNKTTQLIKEDTKLFKEEFDARLLELSNYEEQIGELRKNISLLDKKYNSIDHNQSLQTNRNKDIKEKINALETLITSLDKNLDNQVRKLNQKLTTNISRLQNDIDKLAQSKSKSTESKPAQPVQDKPKPQINIDSSNGVEIKEEPLTQ
ncbi:hypothetical protein QUF70_20250 [Desulfobacterales bacterium HSG17]|nr:hypothetical protein [Desulfobacterales bacterium HSG17]